MPAPKKKAPAKEAPAKKAAKAPAKKAAKAPDPRAAAKSAASKARRGDTDVALAELLALADAGDVPASAAAASILAFRGRWEEAAARAGALLAAPQSVYAANVFNDCAAVVRRAAEVLGRPALIEEAAARVPESASRMRDAVLLTDYFRARDASRYMNPSALASALAEAPSMKRFKDKPKELSRHCLALAITFGVDDEIVARWDPEVGDFFQATEVARALMRKGRPDEAWAILERTIWWPGEGTQVAPIELVTDYLLIPLMTPARAEAVLGKARGPESKG